MKKQSLKSLSLKKSLVSNLTSDELKGGTRTSNLCTVYCSLQGGCGTTGPAPTDDNASVCKCL